ncbi:hypothetical protein ACXET9_07120 [Brachybacterium sp. DNPG3]
MTTIQFPMPGSGQGPTVVSAEDLTHFGPRPAGVDAPVEFKVHGLELCRMLQAVVLFAADPRKFPHLSAVRCIAAEGGLFIAALNGGSSAAGQVDILDGDGYGAFSISREHVKSILSIFQRKLPKDAEPHEYELSVEVTERELIITDVSKLFGGDSLRLSIDPRTDRVEKDKESDSDRVLAAFRSVRRGTFPDEPVDLASGVFFSPEEIARIGRAGVVLNREVALRMQGSRLVAPLSTDFIAFTVGTLRGQDGKKETFHDELAARFWRDRLAGLADGVLS